MVGGRVADGDYGDKCGILAGNAELDHFAVDGTAVSRRKVGVPCPVIAMGELSPRSRLREVGRTVF